MAVGFQGLQRKCEAQALPAGGHVCSQHVTDIALLFAEAPFGWSSLKEQRQHE